MKISTSLLSAIGCCATFTLSVAPPCFGADLLDAPGPGYREQRSLPKIESVRRLDALPPQPVIPVDREAAKARVLRTYPSVKFWQTEIDLQWLRSELQRMTEALPELPADNTFAQPFQLFGAPPSRPADKNGLRLKE